MLGANFSMTNYSIGEIRETKKTCACAISIANHMLPGKSF